MLTWREVWIYIRILLRWWWVIFLSVAIATGVAFYFARLQPNYYIARTSLMVGDSLNTAAPNSQVVGLSNTLARYYGELAHREPILGPIAEQLKLPFPWQIIADRMLSTNVNAQANLLEIAITDTSGERAAAITKAIAQELISYSPNSPEKIAEQRSAIETQIQEADSNLKAVDAKITDLQMRKAQLVSAGDIRDAQDQLDALQKSSEEFQTTYNQLLGLRNNSVANSLMVFEAAVVPTSPMPSSRSLTVAMAGAGGLVVALLAIILLEFLDDRWRDGRDLRNRFGMLDLGAVPYGLPMIMSTPEQVALREGPVRDAHTRILLAAIEQGTRLLLVSSPEPSEARSAFSIDLADLFTRSGYRVLLVDADMTVPNLTNMIGRNANISRPVVVHNGDVKMWSYLQPTILENVMLLGRHTGPDGKPLVPSLPWPELVQSLNRAADVIIFDGPSALSSADAALLAPLVDGVVLTLDPTKNNRAAVAESKARLMRRRGANLLGAVVLTGGKAKKGVDVSHQLPAGPLPPLLEKGTTPNQPQDLSKSVAPYVSPEDRLFTRTPAMNTSSASAPAPTESHDTGMTRPFDAYNDPQRVSEVLTESPTPEYVVTTIVHTSDHEREVNGYQGDEEDQTYITYKNGSANYPPQSATYVIGDPAQQGSPHEDAGNVTPLDSSARRKRRNEKPPRQTGSRRGARPRELLNGDNDTE